MSKLGKHQRWEIWGRHNDGELIQIDGTFGRPLMEATVEHYGPPMLIARLEAYDNRDDMLASYSVEFGDGWTLWLEHFPIVHPHYRRRPCVVAQAKPKQRTRPPAFVPEESSHA